MIDEHGLSARKACQAVQLARSVLNYRSVVRNDQAVIAAIEAYLVLKTEGTTDVLPYKLVDVPQFCTASCHDAVRVSENPYEGSEDDIIHVLSSVGFDLPGNLILG